MPLRLYNTLTRRKEPFEPIDPAHVRMYVCGPTVYDFAHIGNARPIIVFDVLFRLLRHLYPKVTYVRNITDIDDKINARAAEEGVPIDVVTARTTAQFHEDIKALGVLMPEDVAADGTPHTFIEPRATDHVAQMIDMIETLIINDCAYVADGHVLFSVSSMTDYGRLSRRSLDELLAGARVDVAPYKRDPMDFVLWKPSTPELPGWDSPWGRGRPGWHIECSAMSKAYLGETFDIHGGGIDLVFPHHENELAQSRCAHHSDIMAKVWMHNGYLQVEGRKMSKSEGNFVTIHELLNTDSFGGHSWCGSVLKFALLSTHYRQPADFSIKALEAAFHILDDFFRVAADTDLDTPSREVIAALEDDLNTPLVMTALHKIRKQVVHPGSNHEPSVRAAQELAQNLNFLGLDKTSFDLWLNQMNASIGKEVSEIEALVGARNKARAAKDWAEADRIRDELDHMGVVLKDGPEGTTWEIRR